MDKRTQALLIALGSIATVAAIVAIGLYEENKDEKVTRFFKEQKRRIDDIDYSPVTDRFGNVTNYIQNRSQDFVDYVQDTTDDAVTGAQRYYKQVKRNFR